MSKLSYKLESNGSKFDESREKQEKRLETFNRLVELYIERKQNNQYVLIKEQRMVLTDYFRETREGKSHHTMLNYFRLLYFFSDWVKKPYSVITKQDVMGYLEHLHKQGKTENTISVTKLTLKVFFKWLNGNEVYPECVSWIKKIKMKKRDVDVKDLPTFEELQKLINHVPSRTEASKIRNQAIVAMLIEMPLRIGELVSPRMKHIQEDSNRGFKVQISGKTGSRYARFIFAQPYLKRWINAHPFKDDPEAPLFLNLGKYYGTRLKTKLVYRVVVSSGKKAGVTVGGKTLYPHAIRYSRLNYLYRTNKFPEAIFKTQIAGWSKNSTMIDVYLRDNFEDVDDGLCELAGLDVCKTPQKDLEEEAYRNYCQPKKCPQCKVPLTHNQTVCHNCELIVDFATLNKEEVKKQKGMEFLDKLIQNPKFEKMFSKMVDEYMDEKS